MMAGALGECLPLRGADEPASAGRAVYDRRPAAVARQDVARERSKIFALNVEFSCNTRRLLLCAARPNSHVPVAVCRSVGIRTRGRTVA